MRSHETSCTWKTVLLIISWIYLVFQSPIIAVLYFLPSKNWNIILELLLTEKIPYS